MCVTQNYRRYLWNQFLHFRKRAKTAFQNSCNTGNQDSVVGNRNILVLTAGYTVFHFSFVKHTATAVNNHFIRSNIVRKFCTGSEFKHRVFASVFSDPFGYFVCTDIITLTMMSTAFSNQNTVSVFYGRECGNTLKLSFQFTFISGKKKSG